MTVMATVQKAFSWLAGAVAGAQLSSDSRTIQPGDVFLAYPGDEADGRHYIGDAIRRGACAVLFDSTGFAWNAEWQVPHLPVPELKQHAGFIAAEFYGQPDRGMFTAAVTGTNGKTSCAVWLAACLSRLGGASASIGTLGVGTWSAGALQEMVPTGYTTPDAVMLQRRLGELQAAGVRAVAIEASSIGLDQGRMNGMHVDAALFTNLSRDHLDYHPDMAAYEDAKAMLFAWPGLAHAVINLDDPAGQRLVARMRRESSGAAVMGYGMTAAESHGLPTLHATDVQAASEGMRFSIRSPFGTAQVRSRVAGQFNVSNLLGVLGVLLARGTSFAEAIEMIELLEPAPGRMQQLGGQDVPLVVIDYAHTPDAIVQALAALRDVASTRQGKLWCVFGCGGDRDPGKRPQMGAAASAGADRVVVTSDNPRSENPSEIVQQIMDGMATGERTGAVHAIEDRAAAILWAIRHAQRQDVILIAGKGHETTQEIHGRKYPFSDAEHATLALHARATMKEPC